MGTSRCSRCRPKAKCAGKICHQSDSFVTIAWTMERRQVPENVAAGSWGRSGRSRTRSGDGEGWGRDREREFLFFSAGGNGGGGPARLVERNQNVRIGLRLALHKAVAGLRPGQDLRLLIVENEFAAIGLDRQHSVAVALFVAHDRDEQRLARPARLHEHAALEL